MLNLFSTMWNFACGAKYFLVLLTLILHKSALTMKILLHGQIKFRLAKNNPKMTGPLPRGFFIPLLWGRDSFFLFNSFFYSFNLTVKDFNYKL